MATYKIVRHFLKGGPFHDGRKRAIKTGLTLEEAQAHCKDPETSSSTCKKPHNVRRTKIKGPWFDGYTEE